MFVSGKASYAAQSFVAECRAECSGLWLAKGLAVVDAMPNLAGGMLGLAALRFEVLIGWVNPREELT